MTIKTKFNIARGALLCPCIFICIGAIGGTILWGCTGLVALHWYKQLPTERSITIK